MEGKPVKRLKRKKIIIWAIIFLIASNIIAFFSAPFVVMAGMANRHVDFKQVWTAEAFGLHAEHFFVQTDDGLRISAYEVETAAPRAVIICLSGIHNPSATIYFGHARLFQEQGYSTLMLDMRAHGESDGNVIGLGYKEWLDVKAIVDYIEKKPAYRNVPIVIMGLSMGATTAINAIGEIPQIDGLISLSAYSSFEDIFHDNMCMHAPKFLADIERPFVSLAVMMKYRVNSCAVNPRKEIQKLGGRPALLMHTKEDTEVPFASFERIMAHAPGHVETFVRDGDFHFVVLDHHFAEPEKDPEYVAALLGFLSEHF